MLFVQRIIIFQRSLLFFFFPLHFKGDKLKNEEERDSLIIDCLVKLGRLDEAAKKLHKMILTRPDHWVYMKTYIRCQVQRCQNFKERVRQQVERDRKSRQQQETTENGIGSEDSTNSDAERSRNSETEKDSESRDSGGVEAAGGEKKSDGMSTLDGQGQGEGEEEEKGKRGGNNERGRGGEGEGEGGETGDEEEEETVDGAKEITVR